MMGFVMVVIGKWSKVVVFALQLSFPILYICKDKVEDEQHFILECKLNENLCQDLFSEPEIKHIQLWNETEKIRYFLETTSESAS